MTDKLGQELAFPHNTSPHDPSWCCGLTKREWFAGMAMHDHIQQNGYLFGIVEIARRAYEMADAMLKKGKK